MLGNIKKLEMKRPRAVEYSYVGGDKNNAVFSMSPYERGFATTVGNSLRRVLLSSLEGYAISMVYFSETNNEFHSIEGVVEGTIDIILSLKSVSIALKDSKLASRTLGFDIKGEGIFCAKNLVVDSEVVVGNPDFVIFTTTSKADFRFEIQINRGWGYVPSEQIEDAIEKEGAIALDCNFSPISLVSTEVKTVFDRTGQDYEELLIKIITRGTMTSEEAFKRASNVLKESFLTFNDLKEQTVMEAVNIREKEEFKSDKILSMSIYHGSFTVRTCFFLKFNDILELGQLVSKTEKELMDKPQYVPGIMEDIKERLDKMGLSLGMRDTGYIDTNV